MMTEEIEASRTAMQQTGNAVMQVFAELSAILSGGLSIKEVHSRLTQVKPYHRLIELHSKQLSKLTKLQKQIDLEKYNHTLQQLSALFRCQVDQSEIQKLIASNLAMQGFIPDQAQSARNAILHTADLIRQGEVGPAFKVIKEVEEQTGLLADSALVYRLHKAKVLDQAKTDKKKAIQYCRRQLGCFCKYAQDIKKVTAAIVIGKEFGEPPEILAAAFLKEINKLLDIPSKDPLQSLLQQAHLLKSMVRDKSLEGVGTISDLQLILGPLDSKHHSTFTCPVTKQTACEDNPPVVLSCGHVLTRNCVSKMVSSSRMREILRCPVCRSRINGDQTLQLRF